jgi:hypothetical protein
MDTECVSDLVRNFWLLYKVKPTEQVSNFLLAFASEADFATVLRFIQLFYDHSED